MTSAVINYKIANELLYLDEHLFSYHSQSQYLIFHSSKSPNSGSVFDKLPTEELYRVTIY